MSKTPKRLTNSEREIMQVLWKSEKPLTASGIIAASPNKEWKNSSVHLLIKSLLDKDLVEVAGFEKTTKNYARTFKPTMSYEDYSIKFMLNDTDKEKRKNIILKMIKEETDLDIVREVLDAAKDKLMQVVDSTNNIAAKRWSSPMISVKKKELFTLLYFFGSLLWWRLANFYMFYNMKRIRFFSLLHRIT